MKRPRTVLIGAYYFPPYANVSVFRTTKHCKFLPEFGWNVQVLTVDPRFYGPRVLPSMPSDVSNAKIRRLPYARFPGHLALSKLLFPLWLVLHAAIQRRRIGAVYLCGSPFYPFLFSGLFTGLLDLPTVLDFRDSWSMNHGYDGKERPGITGFIREHLCRIVEHLGIRFATSVVFATSTLRDEYAALFPRFKDKFSTIHNGYDPDEFRGVTPLSVSPGKTLVLAGQFLVYTPEAAQTLMQALKHLPTWHFLYIGNEHEAMRTAAEANDLLDRVTLKPYLPYGEVLRLVAGSDAALLSAGLANGMGTKIFDYLALCKPILCLVPEDSIIVREFGHMKQMIFCHPPHTPQKLKEALVRLFEVESSPISEDVLSGFTRRQASRRLVGLLDSILAK